MEKKTLSTQAVLELSALAGVNLPADRMERFIPRLVSFYQDMADLEKTDVNDGVPDYVQPHDEGAA